MKKISAIIYICIAISVINILIILFYAKSSKGSNPVSIKHTNELSVSSDVLLPKSINLAGEEAPLHRIDVVEALKKELIVNSYLHSHTIQALKNSPRIFSIIEPILKEAGVPDDFKYLAVIESNLNPLAVSPAGAVGIWQFMENTAKERGLEVNQEVDERYNIEKATRAAAEYLKKSYDKFGSWTIAAASYNAGTGMTQKQMDLQKEKNYYNLLLGDETGRYVFRILALKQILNNPQAYNFNVKELYPAEEVKKVEVKNSVNDWADFAHEHSITYKTLKRFNPWLRKNDLKNPQRKTYEISIPVKTELYK